jgi:hypothetical protein
VYLTNAEADNESVYHEINENVEEDYQEIEDNSINVIKHTYLTTNDRQATNVFTEPTGLVVTDTYLTQGSSENQVPDNIQDSTCMIMPYSRNQATEDKNKNLENVEMQILSKNNKYIDSNKHVIEHQYLTMQSTSEVDIDRNENKMTADKEFQDINNPYPIECTYLTAQASSTVNIDQGSPSVSGPGTTSNF